MDAKKIIDGMMRPVLRPVRRRNVRKKVARDLESLDPETTRLAWRLDYAMNAAIAHARGLVAWRAVPAGRELPQEDRDWCTAVCNSTLAKQTRPPHPDPEIEQVLQSIAAS